MKIATNNWKNQHIKLVIDEPNEKRDDKAVLAVASLYEGLGAWHIEDVRLMRYAKPHKYIGNNAETFWSHWISASLEESKLVRYLLKETFPVSPGDDGIKVDWCTFDGIVRGNTPQEMGLATHLPNPSATLHTRKEVNQILAEIADFWTKHPINEEDPNARSLAGEIKIENPWRQLSKSEIRFALLDLEKPKARKFGPR